VLAAAGAVFHVTVVSPQELSETRKKVPPADELSTLYRRSFAPATRLVLIPETENLIKMCLVGLLSTCSEVASPLFLVGLSAPTNVSAAGAKVSVSVAPAATAPRKP
jgi:hypothetical protein